MMYNNLIVFLVVIFVFSTNIPPTTPLLQPLPLLGACLLLFYLFSRVAVRQYRKVGHSPARFFGAEKRLSILAILLYIVLVYGLDIKYYFKPLSLGGHLPALENICGVLVFVLLLVVVWQRARPAYEYLFQREYRPLAYILTNLRANLPILLPWLILSLLFDLLRLLPLAWLQEILLSFWGDLLLFVLFIVFLVVLFPPLVRRLWGCRPLPEGPFRAMIEQFCHRQGFHSEVLLWPLYEGQVITAGIMGIFPRYRYLMVTPALLATMKRDELEAVLSHEIGHVKRHHLLCYVLLIMGFSLVSGTLAAPLEALVRASDLYYQLLDLTGIHPLTLLGLMSSLPMLLLLLVFFRFIFGFFIRNFERQADLYVFTIQGTCAPLVTAFEKIAELSGKIREQKNWHHFGIGERIDYLVRCERDQRLIRRHDHKVRLALALYLLLVGVGSFALPRLESPELIRAGKERFIDHLLSQGPLRQQANEDPKSPLRYLAQEDLFWGQDLEKWALGAYERSLALEPNNPVANNNLAWLLLTAREPQLRDPERALVLAQRAVQARKEGYILDTLAEAYWANGQKERALFTENRALELDPDNGRYYRRQMEKFSQRRWGAQ